MSNFSENGESDDGSFARNSSGEFSLEKNKAFLTALRDTQNICDGFLRGVADELVNGESSKRRLECRSISQLSIIPGGNGCMSKTETPLEESRKPTHTENSNVLDSQASQQNNLECEGSTNIQKTIEVNLSEKSGLNSNIAIVEQSSSELTKPNENFYDEEICLDACNLPNNTSPSTEFSTSTTCCQRLSTVTSSFIKSSLSKLPPELIQPTLSHYVREIIDDSIEGKLHGTGTRKKIFVEVPNVEENVREFKMESKSSGMEKSEIICEGESEMEIDGDLNKPTEPQSCKSNEEELRGSLVPQEVPINNEVSQKATLNTLIEPSVSSLERQILLKSEISDNKKTKALQLPKESMPSSPSRCEKEMVGDDFAKTRAHILCECERAGVSGGAVPVVASFTVKCDKKTDNSKNSENINQSQESADSIDTDQKKFKKSAIPKISVSIKNKPRTPNNSSNKLASNTNSPTVKTETQDSCVPRDMTTLQDRLRATTCLIKQKISKSEPEKNDDEGPKQSEKSQQLRFDRESELKSKHEKLVRNFFKKITNLKLSANDLSERKDHTSQLGAIENLYTRILELKTIANELKRMESTQNQSTIKSEETNKVYIKFLPSKSARKNKKCCSTEMQTEVPDCVPEAVKESNGETKRLEDMDSICGMFIPSSENPPALEEEEDEDGLDITITFPEFEQNVTHATSSHFSVCFSDISAEALCRLKRCPKEFTLRMDFVQGKMFFKSGKSTVNNFSIGPDLKITENTINSRQSDIISIKPSTECTYTSQIIPVDGTKQKPPVKTLKSTDSELFNVVSLPFIARKKSASTKSCITFKSIKCFSTANLEIEPRNFESMPQIASLTKISSDPTPESVNPSKAALQYPDKKSRNRML